MNEIVKVSHLSKKYGKKTVLKNISFTLYEGQIVGLLGENGSGKTTLIKILTGLLRDYDGEVQIFGNKIGVYSKENTSYLPDQPYFNKNSKVLNMVRLHDSVFHNFDKEVCLKMLDKFKIDLSSQIHELSKGMKEKLQVALVMARKCKFILLDEPLGGVDPLARNIILDTIITNIQPNQTILISTHLISEIERIFDFILMIKEGEIILQGNVDELRTKYQCSLQDLFLKKYQ